jgi:hypothetical protein
VAVTSRFFVDIGGTLANRIAPPNPVASDASPRQNAPGADGVYIDGGGRLGAIVRAGFATLGLLLLAAAAPAADEPASVSAPEATPSKATRPITLNLKELVELREERGHAEFDLGLRRTMWDDPMTRLAFGMAREQASQMRWGPLPLTATGRLIPMPGADPRLVFSGPFASDWSDLTTQEKIGRISEGVVYWGLIIGILSSIHRP